MPIPLKTTQENDAAAFYATFEEFFQAHWQRVVRYLFKKSASFADAEDIASQAFLYCQQHWQQYDAGKASQTTWLFMIVQSRWLNHCRSQKNHVDIDMLSNVLPDDEDPMHQAIELQGARQQIALALGTLPANQKKAVIHRYFGNRSDQEIAGILGTSPGNVRIMIHRALHRMRDAMAQPYSKEYGEE